MQMNLFENIKIFIEIVDAGSFAQAAENLQIHRPAVTKALQQLERESGVRLLQRTTRRLYLTPEGEEFYRRSKPLLSQADDLLESFAPDRPIRGQLRVDMPIAFARLLVIPHLPTFLQQYPGIELELSSSDRLVDVIREGFDCVVRVGALKDSGLIARPLGKLTQINCASPDYLARFGYPQSLEDLADHALIHYASTLGVRPSGFEVVIDGAVRWVKSGGILTVNSTETYQAACIAGLGIIQVPRTGVREALRAGELIEILPQYRAEPLPVSLIYPHRRNLSRRVHLFMESLGGLMKDYVD